MRVCDVCKVEDGITPAELVVQDKPHKEGPDAWTAIGNMDLCDPCREHFRRREWYILAQRAKQVVIRSFLASEVRRASGGKDTGEIPIQKES